jgi:DNA-binding LacI/PurR family transcriptional regulator
MSYVHPMLAAHGLRIGEQVEVVSCDAETARLEAMHPRPASIDIGADEIGFRAVVRLLARIKRPQDRTVSILVAPKL